MKIQARTLNPFRQNEHHPPLATKYLRAHHLIAAARLSACLCRGHRAKTASTCEHDTLSKHLLGRSQSEKCMCVIKGTNGLLITAAGHPDPVRVCASRRSKQRVSEAQNENEEGVEDFV